MSSYLEPRYLFGEGKIFLGTYSGAPVGIETPRHALTFAGARSGKGVACIIPNAKVWHQNLLVIDPKGEAAEACCQDRVNKGQSVFVVDPFEFAKIDGQFRACYNPLDELDIEGMMIQEQLNALTDGIIMRHDPRHAMWDDNAQGILSGLIAFVKLAEEPENQNLIRVREIIRTDEVLEAAKIMKKYPDCGGIMQTAAAILDSEQGSQFLANARENTKWLDSLPMRNALGGNSDFSLSSLKTHDVSIFLVLPPNYLSQHGRFLRLFVRCAIEAMGQKLPDGNLLGKRCLFILDEFFSLGKIDEIQKAAGLMPGMGVHLWPFLQDIGQLTTLYGVDGTETFFGNSDLHQFFANTDQKTLQFMSQLAGVVGTDEAGGIPPIAPTMLAGVGGGALGGMMQTSQKGAVRGLGAGIGALSGAMTASINNEAQAKYQTEMALYQQRMANAGKPRIPPDEMADRVKRRDDVVADQMFCVLNGTDRHFFQPAPYFRTDPIAMLEDIKKQKEIEQQNMEQQAAREIEEKELMMVGLKHLLIIVFFTAAMSFIGYGIDSSENHPQGLVWTYLLGNGTWLLGLLIDHIKSPDDAEAPFLVKAVLFLIFVLLPLLWFLASLINIAA